MKTKHFILYLWILSCTACIDEIKRSYALFDNSIRIQLPESFQMDSVRNNRFVDKETGISVLLLLSKNRKLGNMEDINFDIFYNSVSSDNVNVKNKEIVEVNGLKVGIKEITGENADFVFFTEVNNEVLYGKVEGKVEDESLVSKVGREVMETVEMVSDEQ